MDSAEKLLLCPNTQWAALAADLLQSQREIRVRVRGQSMRPVIRDRETIWVAPPTRASIYVGRVVLYQKDNGLPVIHRVARRQRSENRVRYRIVSDRTNSRGEWVPEDCVLGCVVAVERDGIRLPLQGWPGRIWGWTFLILHPFRPSIDQFYTYGQKIWHKIRGVMLTVQ